NLRGRCFRIVPANGCLTKLSLWSCEQIRRSSLSLPRFGTSQVQGDLRLHLTSTYHGCPDSNTDSGSPKPVAQSEKQIEAADQRQRRRDNGGDRLGSEARPERQCGN